MKRAALQNSRWPAAARLLHAVVLAGAVWAATVLVPSGAHAHWLTKIVREAGETAGGVGAKLAGSGLDDLAGLARHLKLLHPESKGVAFIAHATPEGHWKFVSRDGEVFTAANADEMGRLVRNLAPDAGPAEGKLALYLSEDSVFARSEALKDLPEGAALHLLAGKVAYPLRRETAGGLVAEVRPNILLRLGERRLFDEALWQLSRPLHKAHLRTIALEPGAAHTLSSTPRLDPVTKAGLVDRVDPWKLPSAMKALRGQTAIVTGRVDGELLHFRTDAGERSIILGDLLRAAGEADVNLVVVQAQRPVQPGGRNWLWQRVEIAGLRDAFDRATFADFLDALGAGRGELLIDAAQGTLGRTRLDVVPTGGGSSPITGVFGDWTDDIVSSIAGNVVTESLTIDLVAEERRRELDLRIVPGIPFVYQALYLAGLVLGLAGLGLARDWWRRLWPPEERREYAGRFGYVAARTVRGLLFTFFFLPIVGMPAGLFTIVWGTVLQIWWLLGAPFRFLGWLARRFSGVRQ